MRSLFVLLASVILGLALHYTTGLACCGGSAAQLNADVYEIAGYPSPALQTLNPLTQSLQAGKRTVSYSFVVVPGCSAGNMESTLHESLADASDVLGLTFVPVSAGADVTVRATCGVDASNVGLSGGAIADLYPSWPYKAQVNALTTMATYYPLSQKTIWSHEFIGHGLGTWNEQYQLDGNFSATPNLVDFMNTGDNSRQLAWPQNDKDRWERTMYRLSVPDCSGPTDPSWGGTWNPCIGRWVGATGWTYDPAASIWYGPNGVAEWGQCIAADHDCWNMRLSIWIFKASPPYDPKMGFLAPPVN